MCQPSRVLLIERGHVAHLGNLGQRACLGQRLPGPVECGQTLGVGGIERGWDHKNLFMLYVINLYNIIL